MICVNISQLESELNSAFKNCDDFIMRKFSTGNAEIMICCIRELADKNYITDKIIKPLLDKGDLSDFDGDFDGATLSLKNISVTSSEEMCKLMNTGNAILAVQNQRLYVCACSSDVYFGRAVAEPNSDVTVKGPKSGFVEDSDKNSAALRRVIRSEKLKIRSFTMGSETNTRVAVAYLEGRADENIIDEVIRKIRGASATAIVDSGNIEMLLRSRKYTLFPETGSTEKIDKAASLVVSGRVAVICDGSPFVVTAPYLFAESIQSAEDYLKSPFYATFVRLLRFTAWLTAIYLPAIFFAVISYTPQYVPHALFKAILKTREEIPISLLAEIIIMLLVFEVLREVGVRMPRTVGDAVSIMGSIIIGDAATKAGIASPVVILIVAISAISNFSVPIYMNATVLLRLFMVLAAFYFSFFGIIGVSVLLLCTLLNKKSFGVPYLKPIMPFNKRGMEDFLLAIPQKTLGRNELE